MNQKSIQIFTASSGNQSALVTFDDETIRHIHSIVKPEEECNYYKDLSFWGNVIVFTGFGLGYHLRKKLNSIPESATLIIIDYFDIIINDYAKKQLESLPNKKIFISEYENKLRENEIKTLLTQIKHPLIQIVKHPASYTFFQHFYDDIIAFITSCYTINKSSVLPSTPPLLLYGNHFLQNEMKNAIANQYTCAPNLFYYDSCKSTNDYESKLHKLLQQNRPSFILSINMKGFDGNGILAQASLIFDIPLVVWFVDDPHPILLHQEQFVNKNMTAFCWEKSYLPFLATKKFNRVVFMPLATDSYQFSPNSDRIPSIPIGFVGSSMGEEFLNSIKEKFLWKDILFPIVIKATEYLLVYPGESIYSIIQKYSKELSIPIPFTDTRNITWLCSYIIHMASNKKRKQFITTLIPEGIELFGDPKGWNSILGSKCITHPDIDYSTQICSVYQNIAININITSCQMPTSVNQRVFDIPMSGSFVLSDSQKNLEQFFEIDKEAVCYRNIAELLDKVRFYKKNISSRKSIIQAAQMRINGEHTYAHRLKSIIKIIT